jgi:hypothetical protein
MISTDARTAAHLASLTGDTPPAPNALHRLGISNTRRIFTDFRPAAPLVEVLPGSFIVTLTATAAASGAA